LCLAEAIAVRWSDIDLNTGKLIVRQGKGAKDRSLWIGDGDLRLLRKWRQRQVEEDALKSFRQATAVAV